MAAANIEKADLLGRDADKYLGELRLLVEALSGTRYALESLPETATADLGRASATYWREILLRCHLASALAIHRGLRWVAGIELGYQSGNFLAFAACLRGFLESTADTHDCFRTVPHFLEKTRDAIASILTDQSAAVFVGAPSFEERLIHFTHARRLKKDERAPDAHKAKPTTDYIKSLEEAKVAEIFDLYSELCDCTHPAFGSTNFAIDVLSQDLLAFNARTEPARILELLDLYRKTIEQLPDFAFDEPVLTLGMLNLLPATEFHTQREKLPTATIRARLRTRST